MAVTGAGCIKGDLVSEAFLGTFFTYGTVALTFPDDYLESRSIT
jgi:hypothetical protein